MAEDHREQARREAWMLSEERIAGIRKRVEAASAAPWAYNSYSMVQWVAEGVIRAWEGGPDYPDTPRPGPPWFEDADRVWYDQQQRAYDLDIEICSVPAFSGDTALGRHASDAEFIAHAREDIPDLLAERDALAERVRVLGEYHEAAEALIHAPSPMMPEDTEAMWRRYDLARAALELAGIHERARALMLEEEI